MATCAVSLSLPDTHGNVRSGSSPGSQHAARAGKRGALAGNCPALGEAMHTSINRRIFILGAGATAVALSRRVSANAGTAEAWERAADIARNVRAPTFPDRVFDITKHGAVADATTLNTAAIARAIDACAAAGGGRVLVPAGTFLTEIGRASCRERV